MKILTINQISESLEIVNLTEEETERILSTEEQLDQYYVSGDILTEHGYFTQEPGFTWMIGEEFPVYDDKHGNEPITFL